MLHTLLHIRARLPKCKLPLAALPHRLSGLEAGRRRILHVEVLREGLLCHLTHTRHWLAASFPGPHYWRHLAIYLASLKRQVCNCRKWNIPKALHLLTQQEETHPSPHPTPKTTARSMAMQVYTSQPCTWRRLE